MLVIANHRDAWMHGLHLENLKIVKSLQKKKKKTVFEIFGENVTLVNELRENHAESQVYSLRERKRDRGWRRKKFADSTRRERRLRKRMCNGIGISVYGRIG